MGALAGLGCADERHGNIEGGAMIAQPLIQNHVARRGQSVDRLLHRDGFFEDERGALGLEVLAAGRTADDDERYGVANGAVLQPFQKTGSSAQITVNDESVDLRLGQLGPGPIRL